VLYVLELVQNYQVFTPTVREFTTEVDKYSYYSYLATQYLFIRVFVDFLFEDGEKTFCVDVAQYRLHLKLNE